MTVKRLMEWLKNQPENLEVVFDFGDTPDEFSGEYEPFPEIKELNGRQVVSL